MISFSKILAKQNHQVFFNRGVFNNFSRVVSHSHKFFKLPPTYLNTAFISPYTFIKKNNFFFITSDKNISTERIIYNGHTLCFPSDLLIQKKASKKKREYNAIEASTKKLISKILHRHFDFKSDPLLDIRYRDRCFWPINGLYISPTLSQSRDISKDINTLPNSSSFVMGSCLFGGCLVVETGNGTQQVLMDHQLALNSKVNRLMVNQSVHPYEMMVWSSYAYWLPRIAKLNPNMPIIRYHLPISDYILQGVKLYRDGIFDDELLDQYIVSIQARGKMHRNVILELTKSINPDVQMIIESPFDPLFDKDILELSSIEVLNCLGMLNKKNISEESWCEFLLNKLSNNNNKSSHQKTWAKIKQKYNEKGINTIEELFYVANTVLIATEATNKSEYDVCSILPVSEEPIVRNYTHELADEVGHIQSLIWLHPVLYNDIEQEEDNLFKWIPPENYSLFAEPHYREIMDCFSLPTNVKDVLLTQAGYLACEDKNNDILSLC